MDNEKSYKSDHDMLADIHVVLLGTNGQGGLLRDHDKLKEDYYKFKRRVLTVFYFLLGSGVLGVSSTEIIKLLNGG